MNESDRRVFLWRAERIEQDESEQMKLRGICLELGVPRYARLDHPAALTHAVRGRLLTIATGVAVAMSVFGLCTRHGLSETEDTVVRDHQPRKQHHRDHQVAAD